MHHHWQGISWSSSHILIQNFIKLTISSLGYISTVSISSGTKSDMWTSHSSIIFLSSRVSGSSLISASSVISITSSAVISLSYSRRFLLYLFASALSVFQIIAPTKMTKMYFDQFFIFLSFYFYFNKFLYYEEKIKIS